MFATRAWADLPKAHDPYTYAFGDGLLRIVGVASTPVPDAISKLLSSGSTLLQWFQMLRSSGAPDL